MTEESLKTELNKGNGCGRGLRGRDAERVQVIDPEEIDELGNFVAGIDILKLCDLNSLQ
jgi:hypothetical protein